MGDDEGGRLNKLDREIEKGRTMEKMKILKGFVLIAMVWFLSVNLSFADEKDVLESDGTDWLSCPMTAKVYWLHGLISGTYPLAAKLNTFSSDSRIQFWPQSYDIIIEEIFRKKVDSKDLTELLKWKTSISEKLSGKLTELIDGYVREASLSNIKIGTMNDGIDTFYKDFSNRRIKMIDAVYIVKMQIEGVKLNVIEAQIRYLKMQPLDSMERDRIWAKRFEMESKRLDYLETNTAFYDGKRTLKEIRDQWEKEKKVIEQIREKYKWTKEEKLKLGIYVDEEGKEWKLFQYGKYYR